jgi:hypothetical protein
VVIVNVREASEVTQFSNVQMVSDSVAILPYALEVRNRVRAIICCGSEARYCGEAIIEHRNSINERVENPVLFVETREPLGSISEFLL